MPCKHDGEGGNTAELGTINDMDSGRDADAEEEREKKKLNGEQVKKWMAWVVYTGEGVETVSRCGWDWGLRVAAWA